MDIAIITEFTEDFSQTDNDRFLYVAKSLMAKHSVEIVTSSFRHTTKSQRERPGFNWPFDITFVKEPGYPKNVCLKRFFSHFVWGIRVASYLRRRATPDVVYCAIPSLTAPYLVGKYCKRHRIRFVIDVQDLWPEAFKMVFNIPLLNSLLMWPFSFMANSIYGNADGICAVSQSYAERALKANKVLESGTAVYLGTELRTFDENVRANLVKKTQDELWLVYCGTLGASYDLITVIDALAILKQRGVRVPKFIVLGDGERLMEFQRYAKDSNIDCMFTGRLPYSEMCGWLAACDIAVNPIVGESAASIINKHGDYAMGGLPVLNTQNSKEYRSLVENYNMGFNCVSGDSQDLAEKLQLLIDDTELRSTMERNARRCAEECFDRSKTYKELIRIIGG